MRTYLLLLLGVISLNANSKDFEMKNTGKVKEDEVAQQYINDVHDVRIPENDNPESTF